MSGGLYGRGKAPERQCLPVDCWPEADRVLWTKACARGSILDDEVGARADHAEISNTKAAKGYGRWITYLTFHDPEALTLPPADRITRDRVIAYVEHLREIGNASQTILARLQELTEVAKVMGPSVDWRFINKISSKVRATHRPARSKHHLKLTHELVNLGFELMASATDRTDYRHAIAYRDGLIIAFLALDPVRRRNLADLVIGRTLLRQTSGWLIAFTADDTKTHTVHEVPLPDTLAAPLEAYLEVWKPILEARTGRWIKSVGGALWVSKDRSPMTQMALYDRIRARTKAKWGKAINPHLFRDAAATTLSIVDPGHVRIAASVLGHRSFGTTEKYYNQAKGYLRVSTGRQAENDVSLPSQRELTTRYCEGQGWSVVEEYVEPGASAIDDRRPVFQRMLDDAKSPDRRFDVICVYAFSRFYRNGAEMEMTIRRLRKCGVEVVSVTQPTGDDPSQEMMRQMIGLFDEYTSRENGKNVSRAMRESAKQGFWNGATPPLGYKIVEAETRGAKIKKKLAVDPVDAETV